MPGTPGTSAAQPYDNDPATSGEGRWVRGAAPMGTVATASPTDRLWPDLAVHPRWEHAFVHQRQNHTEAPDGSRLGRSVLLCGAYAPVFVIVGVRGMPGWPAICAASIGLVGIAAWALFLWKVLPHTGSYPSVVDDIEYVDSDVTGYIVSILLPVIAAPKPTAYDWGAYAAAAALIVIVAFVARLWIVNPVAYLFGYRAAKATLDGRRTIVLVRTLPPPGATCTVTGALGVETLHLT